MELPATGPARMLLRSRAASAGGRAARAACRRSSTRAHLERVQQVLCLLAYQHLREQHRQGGCWWAPSPDACLACPRRGAVRGRSTR